MIMSTPEVRDVSGIALDAGIQLPVIITHEVFEQLASKTAFTQTTYYDEARKLLSALRSEITQNESGQEVTFFVRDSDGVVSTYVAKTFWENHRAHIKIAHR